MSELKTKKMKNTSTKHKVLTIVGIIMSIILIPILIINVTLIVKSYTEPEKVPSIGGIAPMIVLTDSMYPEIQSGDLIICNVTDAKKVKVGDIITYFDPKSEKNAVVTHRVVEIQDVEGKLAFITKGDANNTNDADPIPEQNLVGIYDFRIGGAGNIAMFMQTTQGLIVCVVVPLFLLVGYDIFRRKGFEKASANETEALLAELEKLKAEQSKEDK
ncbi:MULTISPECIES: signal peptidase I [Breznakia]|uniref:Signal peptidase I n=1 Tax=Breznakia blatticola TaxID=1754012 RepID=A0A4R7ZRH1_9FIRM|nr:MULTISPECIES: signal peptidase I [Breznakia]MDH6367501.1 signal peptidase [Breznakia sp. PH1-1]MDH6404621.1 signal peptidase [Breznakia sp. PF1-11]MDH6412330.1 signal peptidase [Breznakia sp. PFB1-11]MDH6414668.1 signal peptidase [Breznakia sp. PFB1-14]MDH6416937.1 signal peptidase [Breznakia sp. PFB1-4]